MMLSTHGLDRRVRRQPARLPRRRRRRCSSPPGRTWIRRSCRPCSTGSRRWRPATCATPACWPRPISAIPCFRPFDAVAANFGQVMFDRAWQVDPGPAWRVVARYTNGGTALAERTSPASGRVLLFTSDVDRKWNDFPLNPAFVPFAQEVARYLGARPPAVSAYLVADVPAGVAPRPGLVRPGNRTLAINVDPRESSVERRHAGGVSEAGDALVRRVAAARGPPRPADRGAAELLALRAHADARRARRGSLRGIAMMNLTQSLDTVRRRWRTLLALRASARALHRRRADRGRRGPRRAVAPAVRRRRPRARGARHRV